MAMEWSDLRVFLAIARGGTLAAAARALHQTQPTMGRRLRALEQALGHALFQRTADGFVLTDEGRLLMEHAERIDNEATAFRRRLAGHDNQLDGMLRLTSPEWLGTYVLAPVLAEFSKRHPGVLVELVTDARLYSLSRQEADLAVRITGFEDPDIISRKLFHIPYALYGAKGTRAARLGEGQGVRLITMDTALSNLPDAQWLRRLLPRAQIAFRSNNREVQAQLCARGAGIAVLPRVLGDATDGIVALDVGEAPPGKDAFVGYHHDLRRLPRLRAMLELIVEKLVVS